MSAVITAKSQNHREAQQCGYGKHKVLVEHRKGQWGHWGGEGRGRKRKEIEREERDGGGHGKANRNEGERREEGRIERKRKWGRRQPC